MNNSARLSKVVVALERGAIGLTGISWFVSGHALNTAVASVALLLTVVPDLAIKQHRLRHVATTVLSTLLVAHIVLGMHFTLYETSEVYDKTMHVLGSGAIALVFFLALGMIGTKQQASLSGAAVATTVFAGTVCAGTLWEIFEFAIDLTGAFKAQRGLRDTMLDLIADAIGALLALLLIAVKRGSVAFEETSAEPLLERVPPSAVQI